MKDTIKETNKINTVNIKEYGVSKDLLNEWKKKYEDLLGQITYKETEILNKIEVYEKQEKNLISANDALRGKLGPEFAKYLKEMEEGIEEKKKNIIKLEEKLKEKNKIYEEKMELLNKKKEELLKEEDKIQKEIIEPESDKLKKIKNLEKYKVKIDKNIITKEKYDLINDLSLKNDYENKPSLLTDKLELHTININDNLSNKDLILVTKIIGILCMKEKISKEYLLYYLFENNVDNIYIDIDYVCNKFLQFFNIKYLEDQIMFKKYLNQISDKNINKLKDELDKRLLGLRFLQYNNDDKLTYNNNIKNLFNGIISKLTKYYQTNNLIHITKLNYFIIMNKINIMSDVYYYMLFLMKKNKKDNLITNLHLYELDLSCLMNILVTNDVEKCNNMENSALNNNDKDNNLDNNINNVNEDNKENENTANNNNVNNNNIENNPENQINNEDINNNNIINKNTEKINNEGNDIKENDNIL